MAEKKLKGAGGKAATAATWEPEGIPASTDWITLTGTGACEVATGTMKCQRVYETAYTGTLSITTGSIAIGGTEAPPEVEGKRPALLLVAGATFTAPVGSSLKFVSTSATQQTIVTAGKTMPETTFEGTGSSYLLEDNFTGNAKISHTKGTLNTNGKTVTVPAYANSTVNTKALTLGASTIVVNGTGNVFEAAGTGITYSIGSATLEITDGSTVAKTTNLPSGWSTIVVAGDNVKLNFGEAGTIGTLSVNNKAKPFKIKGQLKEGGTAKVLVVESEESPLELGMEVVHANLPAGTFLSVKIKAGEWELSANATAPGTALTIEAFHAGCLIESATKLTLTTFTSNGSATEPTRLATHSLVAAEHKLLKSSGRVVAENMRIHNSHAEGGAEWYAPPSKGCVDCGGNAGWKFEDPPATSAMSMIV